jgi:hypothetical protein
MEIRGNNVNGVLAGALEYMKSEGMRRNSRLGPVLVAPEPVTLTYFMPRQRVLFWGARDANPYFHLMEAIWMVYGNNDVHWPQFFNKRFREYSDDGETLRGAYGWRWRWHFGVDQIGAVVDILRADPDSRRAVITMFDPNVDLKPGRDIPCNVAVYFSVNNGALNMTVVNRSNDLIWGACGANAVHFSVLQEFIATALGLVVGRYTQFTNNLHIYEQHWWMLDHIHCDDRYAAGTAKVADVPLFEVSQRQWVIDAGNMLRHQTDSRAFVESWFRRVALPMYLSWVHRKNGGSDGRAELYEMPANTDWHIACAEWLERRT